MSAPDDRPVGSVAEEAAKLFGVLADWTIEQAREVDDHVATGGAECLYCPVCRTVHALRRSSPEVRAQVAGAASALLQAAGALLAAASQTAGDAAGPGTRVQHIDVDDLTDEDPDEDLA